MLSLLHCNGRHSRQSLIPHILQLALLSRTTILTAFLSTLTFEQLHGLRRKRRRRIIKTCLSVMTHSPAYYFVLPPELTTYTDSTAKLMTNHFPIY
uniref:Uncharacterized protein n=1 Tax=Octopus bimaculoides TaxID=37653 RepID=A0A0L8I3Q9_OCTBM